MLLLLLLIVLLQKTLPVLLAATTVGGARSNVAVPANTTYVTDSAAMAVITTLLSLKEYS